jgi:hypothetical protein
VTGPPYQVEIPEGVARAITDLEPDERREVLGGLHRLRTHPLPGAGTGVSRIRMGTPVAAPTFYSVTGRFGIFHTVEDRRVVVLDVSRRPQLRLTRG